MKYTIKQFAKKFSVSEHTVSYMESKVKHYEDILSGILPDDTNPQKRTKNAEPQCICNGFGEQTASGDLGTKF